ncbi:MAG: hypothetical protein ACI9W4_001774 [Rhodothermales bacterium]|jgi:hypothetical protein
MTMHATPESDGIPGPNTGRAAGAALLTAAILTVVAMGHHPSGPESPAEGLGMTLGAFIHGTMIVILCANLWGLTVFSLRQGRDPWILAGLLTYGIGFLGHLVAAMINGFVVPAVAAQVDPTLSRDVFQMLWQANQASAALGIYAASAAFLFWSVFLLRSKTSSRRLLGGLGLLVALGPATALYAGAIALDVDGAFIAYGAHAVWTGLLGILLLRRSL